MGEKQIPTQQEMDEEADSFTGGPGVVATKSQARGGIAGIAIGAVIGALLGVLVGALFLQDRGVIIAVIAFAVAGSVAGGTTGGFLRPTRKLPPSDADVR